MNYRLNHKASEIASPHKTPPTSPPAKRGIAPQRSFSLTDPGFSCVCRTSPPGVLLSVAPAHAAIQPEHPSGEAATAERVQTPPESCFTEARGGRPLSLSSITLHSLSSMDVCASTPDSRRNTERTHCRPHSSPLEDLGLALDRPAP